MSTNGSDDRETIRALLRKINDAWVKGHPDVFVFRRDDRTWRAIWRTLIPSA